MKTPEQLAREKIDRLLVQAGWVLQDRATFNRTAAALGTKRRPKDVQTIDAYMKRED